MLKKVFLLLSILFLSCNTEKSTYFSGKIIKPTNNEITLLKDELVIKSLPINNDGTFISSIDIKKDGLYNFIHLPEFQYLIINKGDSLSLRLNSLDFDESLVFSGTGSEKNNFLIDVFLDHELEENFIRSNYNTSGLEFYALIDSLLKNKILKFEKFSSNLKLNKTSSLIIENAIKLPLLSHIESYLFKNKKEYENNLKLFMNYRNNIDLNNETLLHFKPYLDYIILRSINESFKVDDGYDYSLKFNLNRLEFINSMIYNDIIKNKLLRFIAYEYLLEEKLLINIDTFIHEFDKVLVSDKTKDEIKELYMNISALQIGKSIPDINLIQRDGTLKKIRDIKNSKNVFLFWSYDQNSHQINLFNKVYQFSKNYLDFNFYMININDDFNKWVFNISEYESKSNIINMKAENFQTMSKKMVLNNLNKVIITKNNIINGVINITEMENFLDKN